MKLFTIRVDDPPRGQHWKAAGVVPGAKMKARDGRVKQQNADGHRVRSKHIGSVLLHNQDGSPLLDAEGIQFRLLSPEYTMLEEV